MDLHQKTLLSDEFGVGFGGLVLERLFHAAEAVDVSAALQDAGRYQGVTQSDAAQPDYLMWNPLLPNAPYYVVECKGCQTRRDATTNQIRRGLEQVKTLIFRTGSRDVRTLVVATLMQASGTTTVYVIEGVGKNTWRIENPEEFANAAWSAKRAKLLNWAGQFASAREAGRRRRPTEQAVDMTDLKLESRTIGGVTYRGQRTPLFPELGYGRLRVFAGVQEEILETARHETSAANQEQAARQIRPLVWGAGVEADTSTGPDGTCLVVEGI